MSSGRLLIFAGIALIASGILVMNFFSDLEEKPIRVNLTGAGMFIIGLLCFAARGWIKWYSSEETGLEGLASGIQDVKTKKGKSKIKPILIVIGLIAFILFVFI